jgi:hypothetical protein
MPFRHDQMLPVVCRILASLSHCWFVCVVFSTTWLEFKDMAQDHWSDESRFLFHVTDDRMRVWRYKNTAYTTRNILYTTDLGSWLAKEQKSWLRFGGRRLLLLNDEAWRCHPYTQAL